MTTLADRTTVADRTTSIRRPGPLFRVWATGEDGTWDAPFWRYPDLPGAGQVRPTRQGDVWRAGYDVLKRHDGGAPGCLCGLYLSDDVEFLAEYFDGREGTFRATRVEVLAPLYFGEFRNEYRTARLRVVDEFPLDRLRHKAAKAVKAARKAQRRPSEPSPQPTPQPAPRPTPAPSMFRMLGVDPPARPPRTVVVMSPVELAEYRGRRDRGGEAT